MSNTYPNEGGIRGAQFVRFVPVTMASATSKVITSFGTAVDLLEVEMEHPKFANIHTSPSYITKKLSGGDTIKNPENTNAYLAADGSSVSKDDNFDSVKFSASLGYADFKAMKAIFKNPAMRAAVCIGFSVQADTGDAPGFLFVMGKALGDLEGDFKEDIITYEITVEGSEVLTHAAGVTNFNTKMAGTVTLIDGSSEWIIPGVPATASTSDEWDDLLAGKLIIVDKAVV